MKWTLAAVRMTSQTVASAPGTNGDDRSVRRSLRPRRPASAAALQPAGGPPDWYGGVVVGPETIGARALEPATHDRVLETISALEPDDYSAYVADYVGEGRRRFGAAWRYADILTVLAAATELLAPAAYLELGVRRGRSMAVVAAAAPECAIVGVDLWQEGYAGMENPGPDLVRGELANVGHRGPLELLSGDSHDLLPRLFAERPDATFDLVTVDGDHSAAGAERDLRDVLPHLRTGGVLVFDDVRHPLHPELNDVWRRVVESDRRYAAWRFDGLGFGVALAVRRW
jgi:predicted O-methyltransferase YrrM